MCGDVNLVETPPAAKVEGGLRFSFGMFGCDECGQTYTLDGGLSECPGCGVPHDEPDAHVEARVEAYGEELHSAGEALRNASRRDFTSRGPTRVDYAKYQSEVTEKLIRHFQEWIDEVTKVMGSADWDEPSDMGTRAAWQSATSLIDSIAAYAIELKRMRPPATLLSFHRANTRTVISFGQACLGFFETLTKESRTAAQAHMKHSQRALDRAGSSISLATSLLGAVYPWTAGEELSLAEASARSEVPLRREVFPELRLLARADPEAAAPFWQLTVMSAAVHDTDRRLRRVAASRSLIQAGLSGNLEWTGHSVVLFREIMRAWRQLLAQSSRLSRAVQAVQTGVGAEQSIEDALNVSMMLLEGPLKRLGAILCVAHKAKVNTTLVLDEESFESACHLSDVLDYLDNNAPVLTQGLNKLIRNASAHYDAEVSEEWVQISHVARPGAARQSTRLSYDDVIEHSGNALELATAISVALVDWILESRMPLASSDFHQMWLDQRIDA